MWVLCSCKGEQGTKPALARMLTLQHPLRRRIYAERQGLNERVAAALQAPGAPDLAPALTELKANLAAEMRAVSEEHFLLLRLLLSPTQARACCA